MPCSAGQGAGDRGRRGAEPKRHHSILDVENLLEEGLRCGLSHAEFWELTPREVVLAVQAYGRRLLDRLEAGIAAAWHGESFARSQRLPALEKVLERRSRRTIDRAFTARETLRWTQKLAEMKKAASND